MTVCNMAIEGGARAGLIAPDETTFDYVRGPAPRAEGRRMGGRDGLVAHAALGRGRPLGQGGDARGRGHRAGGHLGHLPRGRAADRRRGCPTRPPSRAARPRPRAARSPTWASRPARRLRDVAIDTGVHRLVHQRPHRGPARRGGYPARAADQGGPARHGRAGLGPRARAGRGRGAGRRVPGRGLRVAPRGLLDVPGDEPRPALTGRALRGHVEPQLRGAPGPGGGART